MLLIDDGEIAALTREDVHLYTLDGAAVERDPLIVNWDVQAAEKGGYPHFFLKEINEQPRRWQTRCADVSMKKAFISPNSTRSISRESSVWCCRVRIVVSRGTGGQRVIEQWVRVPAEAIIASEFR